MKTNYRKLILHFLHSMFNSKQSFNTKKSKRKMKKFYLKYIYYLNLWLTKKSHLLSQKFIIKLQSVQESSLNCRLLPEVKFKVKVTNWIQFAIICKSNKVKFNTFS